ncbi:Ribosomal protein L23A [Giardia muris]|uniref:Ribosomal protein L23A n=1 Tax=Giardia muris TaxID=5742 RepID=A0A4Z1T321_GIAMU|nr:Ribosomal protein L23A [Giardia muris]|eukprot:TNJ26959.1 Ribosomal protein L23A [Giardia muris]
MVTAGSDKAKALHAQKAITKGEKVIEKKVRRNVHFFRPKTLKHPKAPEYSREPLRKDSWQNPCDILRYPIKNDANTNCIEKHNTIVFMVDRRATKPMIRKAFEKVFEAKVLRVNTLITPIGMKKAFIRLVKECNALDVASKMGLA